MQRSIICKSIRFLITVNVLHKPVICLQWKVSVRALKKKKKLGSIKTKTSFSSNLSFIMTISMYAIHTIFI